MGLKNNNILNNNHQSINDIEKENLLDSLKNFLDNDNDLIKIAETATIDKIESDIVVCELSDKEFINIPTNKFNFDIHESDIINLNLTYENGKVIDIEVLEKNDSQKNSRTETITEKFNKLKKH